MLLLIACSKESTDRTPAETSFTYKADGTAVTVDSAHAVLYRLGIAPFNRMIDVYAYKGGIDLLEFHFKRTVVILYCN